MSLFGKKPTALDIHQYVVQFTAKAPDGTKVKSESMHSGCSAVEAFKAFEDTFKNDDRVEKIDRILMVCEGWRV